MKSKNFSGYKAVGDYEFAEVEVKSWLRPWAMREVYKGKFSACWRWLDSGKYCEGHAVDDLAHAAEAKRAALGEQQGAKA